MSADAKTDKRPPSTRSHHETSLWDEKRSPMVRVCHRAIFALILFVIVYSVIFYGSGQAWTQGPIIAAIALAAVFWAVRIVVVKEVEVVFSPLGAPLIVLGIYTITRYALSEVEPVSRSSMLLTTTAVLFYFVVLNDIRHRWQVTVIVWTLTSLGLVLSVYALIQVLRGGEWVLGVPQHQEYWGSGSGTFFRPADLAVYLHMAFAVAAANFALSRRSDPQKLGFAVACIAMLGGMFLTFSTIHWAGWLVMFGTLSAFVVRKRSWNIRWVIAGAAVLTVAAAVVFSLFLSQSLDGSMPAAPPGPSIRAVWPSALAIGQGNVWIGGGGGMFRWLYPSHRTIQGVVTRCPNQYLDIFAEYGVAGLLLGLWILVGFVIASVQVLFLRDEKYSAYRLSNRYAFAVGGLAAAVGCLIDASYDLNLHSGGILFTLLAIMATTLTCGIHRRLGESQQSSQAGRYVTVHLHGLSRLVLVAGLAGLVLLIGTRLRKIYPAQFMLRRGNLAMDQMKWDDAERCFMRAAKFDDHNCEAAEAMGDLDAARATWNLHQREALIAEAISWYNRAITFNSYDYDARIKIGRLQDLLGKRAEALAAYRDALDGDPHNASYHVALAQHYLRWGDTILAQKNFRYARELGDPGTLPGDEPAKHVRDSS
jgi:tetratricopeptide (TPR) repeat protein